MFPIGVIVRFSLLGLDRQLHEDDLADPALHRAALAKRNRSGIVTIEAPGQPTVELEDEVWHQLQELCNASIALLAGRGATVRYFEMFGDYELKPDGAFTILSGEEVPSAGYNTREFCEAIAGCTERLLDFLVRLADPDMLAVRDLMLPVLDTLRSALAKT